MELGIGCTRRQLLPYAHGVVGRVDNFIAAEGRAQFPYAEHAADGNYSAEDAAENDFEFVVTFP